ncbi:MAG: restriction endonuclease [Nanoarchaeota archaeon]|nr:restriction endonuclease [Nanoarchaeota archaeon]
MYVIKESGDEEKLDLKKLKISILQAGASVGLANKTVAEVKNRAYHGMTTREILHLVLGLLKEEPGVSQRYNLKRAIMMLGPTGFPFEKFVARLLREYGYETIVDTIVRGKCVKQEIDIWAKKNNSDYMVECKYHNMPGKKSDLKVVMYTYARFLDVKHLGFEQPWLVTNTKCTSEVKKYAKCMGIRVISWRYPHDECMEKMLMQKNLYPITTLESLTMDIKQRLVRANIMMASDILSRNMGYLRFRTRLPSSILNHLREEAKQILNV